MRKVYLNVIFALTISSNGLPKEKIQESLDEMDYSLTPSETSVSVEDTQINGYTFSLEDIPVDTSVVLTVVTDMNVTLQLDDEFSVSDVMDDLDYDFNVEGITILATQMRDYQVKDSK